SGLDEYQLIDEVMKGLLSHLSATRHDFSSHSTDLQGYVHTQLDSVRRAGRLPQSAVGEAVQAKLADTMLSMGQAWVSACAQYPLPVQRQAVRFEHAGVVLEDWLDQLVTDQCAGTTRLQLLFSASSICSNDDQPVPRADKLVLPWLRSL